MALLKSVNTSAPFLKQILYGLTVILDIVMKTQDQILKFLTITFVLTWMIQKKKKEILIIPSCAERMEMNRNSKKNNYRGCIKQLNKIYAKCSIHLLDVTFI